MLAVSVAVGAAVARAKRIGGERHTAEEAAGIFLTRCGNAFLIGNNVLTCADEDLRGAFQANDRENAEADEQAIAAHILRAEKPFGELRGDLARDGFACVTTARVGVRIARAAASATVSATASATAITSASTAVFAANYAACKDDGGYGFHNCRGRIVATFAQNERVAKASCTARTKDGRASFAAVKDDAFIEDGECREAPRCAGANASLVVQANVKAHVDLIKTAVEGNGIHRDGTANDFGIGGAHGCGVVDDFFAVRRQVDLDILVTISVTARVQNAHRVDANGFPRTRRRASLTARASVFCHGVSPDTVMV